MPVPDMIRSVTRNVREALSSREGFKEKAKDLPLYVIQTALSGVGQALLLGDRVRNTLRRLTGQTEEDEETKNTGEAAGEDAQDKRARREPVIFAPRPETTEPKDTEETKAESNGTKSRPEPVIFAPAKPKATARKAGSPAEAKAAEPEARDAGAKIAEPAAARVEVTEIDATVPEPAEATKSPAPASAVPAEPMPGYGGLTVASLRARMRGKPAEQIRELLAYERATTARPEVVRMYENRLAKLEAAE